MEEDKKSFSLTPEQVRDVLLPMVQRALSDLAFSETDIWNSDMMKLKLGKERENYKNLIEQANEFLQNSDIEYY